MWLYKYASKLCAVCIVQAILNPNMRRVDVGEHVKSVVHL